MTTDFRALCAELMQELESALDDIGLVNEPCISLIDRARAALDEPELEGPTVMEIIELSDEIEAAELGQVDLVRAALARWGHQSAPPAEGEVEPNAE